MHQSFVSSAPTGPGNSRAFNFSFCPAKIYISMFISDFNDFLALVKLLIMSNASVYRQMQTFRLLPNSQNE